MPDETQNPQDAVATQTPGEGEGQTPTETQTFTQEELGAAVAKAKHDTLVDFNRLETEWKRSQSVAEKALARLQQIEDENYRRQEEAVKDDPDQLVSIRRQRQNVIKEAELNEKEAKIQTRLAASARIAARSLAAQYNTSEDTLLKYASDDLDKMEELAKSYGEKKAGDTKTQPQRMTQAPDDGKTKGGTRGLTIEDVRKMSPEEKNRRVSEISKIPFG